MSQTNQEKQEKLLLERRDYYSNVFVLMEIVKSLKHKELAFLDKETHKKNIRFLFSSKIDFLKMHFEKLDLLKYNADMYHSVADLKNIPVITYNLKARRLSSEYKEINDNYVNHMIGYDFFLDFDLDPSDFKAGHNESRDFKVILEEMQVPYYLLASSKKGLHYIIPSEFFDNSNVLKNVETFREVIGNIKAIYDYNFLDNSIVDIKRLKKVPYSFVSDGSIALPLTDEQFLGYNSQLVDMRCVLKRVKIKERGLLLRRYNLTDEQLKINTAKFLKEFQ